MIAGLGAALVSIVVYPFLLVSRFVIWVAGKLRVDPFYIGSSLLVLPLWLGSLLISISEISDGNYPLGEIAIAVLGSIYLIYVLLLIILEFATRDDSSKRGRQ